MEVWDLYDENRQKINKTMSKSEKRPSGVYNLRVHLCVFNKNGEMLIQQREANKKHWPNIWSITLSGGVMAGESSNVALAREVKEEFGVDIDFSNERPYLTINTEGSFQDIYIINSDIDTNTLQFRDGEVQAVRWASKHEILRMIENKEFLQYHTSFIELMFDMREGRGILQPEGRLVL